MANENNLTPKQWLKQNLSPVLGSLWYEASAKFATKQEAGADYATATEAEAAAQELT